MRCVLREREVEHLGGRLGTAGIDRDQVAHRGGVPDPSTGDRRAVVGDRRVLGGVGDRVAGPVPVGGGVRQRLILSRRCRGHSYSPTEYAEAAKSSSAPCSSCWTERRSFTLGYARGARPGLL